MPREIDFAGATVPGLLLIYLACLLLQWSIDTVGGHFGLYRHVWHPALFRVALFFCLFASIGLLVYP